jgi:hypothetical protein
VTANTSPAMLVYPRRYGASVNDDVSQAQQKGISPYVRGS